jgi:hypothetical protein
MCGHHRWPEKEAVRKDVMCHTAGPNVVVPKLLAERRISSARGNCGRYEMTEATYLEIIEAQTKRRRLSHRVVQRHALHRDKLGGGGCQGKVRKSI